MKQNAKAGMMYKTNEQTNKQIHTHIHTHFDVNQGFENHKFLQPLIKTYPPLLTYYIKFLFELLQKLYVMT